MININYYSNSKISEKPELKGLNIVSVTGHSIQLMLEMSNTDYVSLDSQKPDNVDLKIRPNTFRDTETQSLIFNDIDLQVYDLPRLLDSDG